MKKYIKMFLILLIFMNLSIVNVFATDITDINKINGEGSFQFKDTEDEDMNFSIGTSSDGKSFWDTIYEQYREIILGISALITMSFVAFFIFNIISMVKAGSNSQDRHKAIIGLMWTGIGLAITSSITLFLSIAFNFLT